MSHFLYRFITLGLALSLPVLNLFPVYVWVPALVPTTVRISPTRSALSKKKPCPYLSQAFHRQTRALMTHQTAAYWHGFRSLAAFSSL
jgi:hypothetical protein